MVKGRGVVADVLIKWGALSVGDPIVVGSSYGKVKSMINDKGMNIIIQLYVICYHIYFSISIYLSFYYQTHSI